jgi:hypothetical protein
MRSDDDVDEAELEIERKPAMPKGEWLLGVCGIGAILLFAFGLGVSLGQSRTEVKGKAPVEVVQNEPTKNTQPEAPTAPTKAEPTKAAPTKPEAKPTKPEAKPTKPTPPPTKPTPSPPTKPDPTVPVATVLFAEKIAPLFKRNCNSCHGDPLIKGGLDTRTLASIAKGGDNGKAVVAKDPDKSYLWMQVESGAMPPAGKEKLTPAEIKLIKDWILSGAK